MIKESKVEMLFDDIRGYISNLENAIANKDKEIYIRSKKIEVLEEKNSIVKNTVDVNKSEKVELSKELFNIKSIYYLLGVALKLKSASEIRILFELINRDESLKLTEKSNKLLVDALCFYSIYSFDKEEEKKAFLVKSLEKLNPEKFDGFYRKVFTQIITTYEMQNYIDEDFMIKFIRKTAFSRDKDIAKSILISIVNSGRIIVGQSNIQNVMLIGLYLGIENIRKLNYIQPLYIKAMDSRFDNLFINFLVGKIKLDFTLLDSNMMNIKVLNKNLVSYIYSIAKETKKVVLDDVNYESKLFKTSLIDTEKPSTVVKGSPVKVVEKKIVKAIKLEPLKSVVVNKSTRTCDQDGGDLKIIGQSILYYDPMLKNSLGEVLENILICKTCKKKVVNSDIVRKIYKKIPHSYKLKFKNQKDINLNIFKYNIGLPRSERTKLLKEVIAPAMGAFNVIEALKKLVDMHKMDKSGNYSLSIAEWEHDIKKLETDYDDME
ncbi:hypothetical protein [uncultured Clostridium sp.]|jgi:hypothetical protein|uniref:hypothetical protein n=1 Tax=uncultured Clostridium sp. TaxID=59620 RepID=UPI002614DF49|nr:hypothetical protein [uncultured Clostridium sp.]